MSKQIIALIILIIFLGAAGVFAANYFSGPDAGGTEIRTTEQVIDTPVRTTPQPRANSFGIMTPEEKAAAEAEAERRAAEAAAASSSDEAESDSLEGEDEAAE